MNTFSAMMADNGYTTKTTFWEDFSIADRFGEKAVKDTFNRAFDEWKSNTEYITEMVLVLNHKIWQHCNNNNTLAAIYNELWEKADNWCLNNLKGEDLEYFFRTID